MQDALYQDIVDLILAGIESGAIDKERVREFRFVLSADYRQIDIAQNHNWHGDYIAKFHLGTITNQTRLTDIEPILKYQPQNLEATLRAYNTYVSELTEALKKIAVDQALGTFTKIVGFKIARGQSHSFLACLYHPDGLDILPNKERYEGFIGEQGIMGLAKTGITQFYTELENRYRDWPPKAGTPWFRHYCFADLTQLRIDEHNLIFSLADSNQEIVLSARSDDEIERIPADSSPANAFLVRVLQHIQTHAPERYAELFAQTDSENKTSLEQGVIELTGGRQRHPPRQYTDLFAQYIDQLAQNQSPEKINIQNRQALDEGQHRIGPALCYEANAVWVCLYGDAAGFALIEFDHENRPNYITCFQNGKSFTALITEGEYIYALTENEFYILYYRKNTDREPIVFAHCELNLTTKTYGLSYDNERIAISSYKEVVLFDVSSKNKPLHLRTILFYDIFYSPYRPLVTSLRGNDLFVAYSYTGVFAVDITDINKPILRNFTPATCPFNGLIWHNNTLTGYGARGLCSVDYNDIDKPTLKTLHTYNPGHFIQFRQDRPDAINLLISHYYYLDIGDHKNAGSAHEVIIDIDYQIESGELQHRIYPILDNKECCDLYALTFLQACDDGYIARNELGLNKLKLEAMTEKPECLKGWGDKEKKL